MILSRSIGYGLIAVAYMAKRSDAWTQGEIISKEYDIPIEYLLKIMNQLVRAGILRSKRGPSGGYSLAKPVKDINMLEVIEAVDGPFHRSFDLASQAKKCRFSARMDQVCSKASEQAIAILKKAKFSDLVSKG
ncbi:MAG: Rrf2 family transcriptional regulator [Phycisphaerae bacterium]|nr:Rrf2 family transcriptional regulator [Phycisphaerae bacterium]